VALDKCPKCGVKIWPVLAKPPYKFCMSPTCDYLVKMEPLDIPCKHCGQKQVHQGYGLAGGGIGPYRFCMNAECEYFEKWPELDTDDTEG